MADDKKIGILTFHTADNYGAVLQAYALQNFLQHATCCDVKIINFRTHKHIFDYRIFRYHNNNVIKNIIVQLLTLIKYNDLSRKKKRFSHFRNSFLSLSAHEYSTLEDLLKNIEYKDIYITGSDQVFNPFNTNYKAYYLAFSKGKSKKIAYAPSFGVSEFPDDVSSAIKPLLMDFDAISCRESQGANYMRELLNREIPVVLDPVFLLSKEDWINITISHKLKYNYIFVYDLNGGKQLLLKAKELSRLTNLPIICATSSITNFYNVKKQLYDLGPLELLGYINSASYVLTDSFHGTALSIIMHKKILPFIALKKTSSRILSIMSLLKISNQVIDSNTDMSDVFHIVFCNYDYILNDMIEYSKKWILDQISNYER